MLRPETDSSLCSPATREEERQDLNASDCYSFGYDGKQVRAKAIAIGRGVTLAYMASKKLPRGPREAFARVLAQYVLERHGDNQTAAGKALGVSQPHISGMLSGDKGPGLNTLLLMRLETGRTIDEMLGFATSNQDDVFLRWKASIELDLARTKAEARKAREAVERVKNSVAPELPDRESDTVPVTRRGAKA